MRIGKTVARQSEYPLREHNIRKERGKTEGQRKKKKDGNRKM